MDLGLSFSSIMILMQSIEYSYLIRSRESQFFCDLFDAKFLAYWLTWYLHHLIQEMEMAKIGDQTS